MMDELLCSYLYKLEEGYSFRALAELIKQENPTLERSARTIRKRLSQLAGSEVLKESVPIDFTPYNKPQNFEYKGRKSITSIKEAVDFFNIDTQTHEIVKSYFNAWDGHAKIDGEMQTFTNYQVKLVTEPKIKPFDYQKATEKLKKAIINFRPKQYPGVGKGILSFTDIHVGAKVEGLLKTRDFSYDILAEYLLNMVNEINELNKSKVSVAILGDLIESFTGLNHLNSWQELDKWQGDALIAVYELLFNTLSKIRNLDKVFIVAGNHDRTTSNKEVDPHGNAAKLVAYMLNQNFDVEFNSTVIRHMYDNIAYVFTHGHLGMLKNIHGLVYQYGHQKKYTVVLSGHLHSRFKHDTTATNKKQRESLDFGIPKVWKQKTGDTSLFRHLVVPPLFTGNFFSEALGYTSSPGCLWVEKSKYSDYNVKVIDYGF